MNEASYIEVGRDANGDWRWNAFSERGEVVTAGGEAFKRQKDAVASALDSYPDLELRKVDETL